MISQQDSPKFIGGEEEGDAIIASLGRASSEARSPQEELDLPPLLEKAIEEGDIEWPEDVALSTDQPRNDIGQFLSPHDAVSSVGAFASLDDLPPKIHVANEWDRLRAVLVGCPDHDHPPLILPSHFGYTQPEPPSREDRGKQIKQVDALCDLLEKEHVKVFRTPLLDDDIAKADPEGLCCLYAHNPFFVLGHTVVLGRPTPTHRQKDREAIRPFVLAASTKHVPGGVILVGEPDYVEGCDIVRFDGHVLVGISGLASTPGGYHTMVNLFQDYEFHIAFLSKEFPHLDSALSLAKHGLCIVHLPGFADGRLPSCFDGWDTIEVTHAEVLSGATSGIALSPGRMILAEGNDRVEKILAQKGIDVLCLPFDDYMVSCVNALLREE